MWRRNEISQVIYLSSLFFSLINYELFEIDDKIVIFKYDLKIDNSIFPKLIEIVEPHEDKK